MPTTLAGACRSPCSHPSPRWCTLRLARLSCATSRTASRLWALSGLERIGPASQSRARSCRCLG
eukprot:3695522-Heterocapsa_arctica.AAC.1